MTKTIIVTDKCRDPPTSISPGDLTIRRKCRGDCNSYIMPLSKQMNMASHTIKQRANPHCQTREIIKNVVKCQSRQCKPLHFDDANNTDRTTPFPTRSNHEYLQDKLELRSKKEGNTLGKDCACLNNDNTTRPFSENGIEKNTPANLRTQHIRRRNTIYYKDSAVSGASRIDMLKNLVANRGRRRGDDCCNPKSNTNKKSCCKENVKRGHIRFRR